MRKLWPKEERDLLRVNLSWHRAQSAEKARELWSRYEEGQRRERKFNKASLEMLTSHSYSHPRQIKTTIHNINGHRQKLSAPRTGEEGSHLSVQAREPGRMCPAPSSYLAPCKNLHK